MPCNRILKLSNVQCYERVWVDFLHCFGKEDINSEATVLIKKIDWHFRKGWQKQVSIKREKDPALPRVNDLMSHLPVIQHNSTNKIKLLLELSNANT